MTRTLRSKQQEQTAQGDSSPVWPWEVDIAAEVAPLLEPRDIERAIDLGLVNPDHVNTDNDEPQTLSMGPCRVFSCSLCHACVCCPVSGARLPGRRLLDLYGDSLRFVNALMSKEFGARHNTATRCAVCCFISNAIIPPLQVVIRVRRRLICPILSIRT